MTTIRPIKRCPACGAPSQTGELCSRCADWSSSSRPIWTPASSRERPGGIVLEGKYRLLDEIGRGGMGTVFRAVDESLDRMVAVKFLLPELQTETALVNRFRREARAMASVRHENVLQIYSFGSYGATSFFVMEYIEGRTADAMLMAALARREYLPMADTIRIVDQVCAGLGAVHRAGVVHRDVKPGNVMVQNDSGRAVVMDFGIGRRYQPGSAKRTLQPGGTPAYMAPEVIAGLETSPEQERLSDIYALGVTTFELITGVLPFSGGSWVDVFQLHIKEPPPVPSSLRKGLPEGVDDVILKCLAKAPLERFQSCDEVREALRPFVTERRATPAPPDFAPRAERTPSRPERAASGVESRARIVVADPDPSFRSTVYQLAEEAFPGCRFQAARTPLAALDLARAAPPLLLIAPLHDPDLNGLELSATLWGDETLHRVRVVLTAERITPAERAMLAEMGVSRVLVRPVASDDLRSLLGDLAAEDRGPRAETRS
jgi:serine/threonine protein kinase